MSPFTAPIGVAPGWSATTRGSEIELMPSRTTPIFSNSADISHITHWLMPWKRSTSAAATAMAPAVILPLQPLADADRRPRRRAGCSSSW